MIRVLLADDQDLIRLGLRVLLDNEDDLDVVGDAADGLRAVQLAQRLRPDVILMDVRMPGIDGIEATGRIVADRERGPLALVAEGLSNDEIAGRLTISPATARTHVSRAMVKLGARDRAQLVVFAYQSGLVH